MRGAGADHGTEKRFSLCGLICEPRPSVKRPPVLAARSQPMLAAIIGERGKEIATPVCSSIFFVATPATASARKGSCRFSCVLTPV